MANAENPHVELFRQEASELLADVQECLLIIESDPDDKDAINRLFRAMHSIKGAGGMFGYDRITEFTHHVETVMDSVRDGKTKANRTLIDLVLASHDCIKEMLDDESSVQQDRLNSIIQGLQALVGTPSNQAPPKNGNSLLPTGMSTYRIRFKPDQKIFYTGTDPMRLIQELCDLGESKVICNLSELPAMANYDPELCYLFWDILLTTKANQNQIEDVFIFVASDSQIDIHVIDEEDVEDANYRKLGEILVERGDIPKAVLDETLKETEAIGVRLMKKSLVDSHKIESALAEQEMVRNARTKRQQESAMASIRVNADKLDRLVDLVGELVTAQARITRIAERIVATPELSDVAEELESLTTRLRDETMGIRMVPIGSVISTFRRLVRDLAKDLGKDIDFQCLGEETELDKGVIERLKDPLVHIIRNSTDHGIEMPDLRAKAGKNVQGTIRLEAMHSGAHVLIKITDDGKGLDVGAIRKKAIDKGIISSDQTLSDNELHQLIFAPGFSTAEKVTELSGRGVGMDVVRQNIEALRGSIGIESNIGLGTTITLKLPLTLAIIDGLMVTMDEDSFIIPLASVEECVDLDHNEMDRIKGRNIINLRGAAVPFVRLRERLNRTSQAPEREQVVITNLEGKKMGVVVDAVVGSHQTVLKNLGPAMRQARDVSGATILGDGSVALILDLQSIQ